jgi:hypothetical protein
VPEEYYADAVTYGAVHTPSRELLRKLKAAGLRRTRQGHREGSP